MNNNSPYTATSLQELKENLSSALDWIYRSFAVNNNRGSSAYRTSWGQWSPPYPETTGYLIPTLLEAASFLNEPKWTTLAAEQIHYFKNIQQPDGSYPCMHPTQQSNVFDNAQILLGLTAYYKSSGEPDCLDQLQSLRSWIINLIDDEGHITRHNLFGQYNPAYYMRIVWPVLYADTVLQELHTPEILRLYRSLRQLFKKGHIDNLAFIPGEKVYSHTLMYALRGYLESAILLQDTGGINFVTEYCQNLVEIIITREKFPGAWSPVGAPDYGFICTTGSLQFIVLLLQMNARTSLEKLDRVLDTLAKPVWSSQRSWLWNRGAVPSSIPVYGPYQRWRYTNWTQKFLCDALMSLYSYREDQL